MSKKRLPRIPGYRYSLLPEERAAIMERSGGRCERCGATQEDRPADWPAKRTFIETHHKVQVAEGGDNSPENMEMLCRPCHLAIPVKRKKRFSLGKKQTTFGLTPLALGYIREMAAMREVSMSCYLEQLLRREAFKDGLSSKVPFPDLRRVRPPSP